MCSFTVKARFPQPDDSTFGQIAHASSSSQTSDQRWRPLVWPSNRWKLSSTSLCSLLIFIWTFSVSARAQTVPTHKPLRNTVYGKIQGYVREVLPDKFVEYYLGVPYAAPPVGDLRFANPEEPKPWKEILVTDNYPPACMQKNKIYIQEHRNYFGEFDEDCLYLNIYVPRTTKKEPLPVFAYVHGGSNIVGMAAMHDGDVFASHAEVIVVMMNYRLAAFGFLTLADPELPGNYGLMDQLLALKWIQRNIEFFGGDKNKVTLSGHSAGAGDVGLHTLSSLAKGLFRFSICHSGSGTAPWVILKTNKELLKSVKDYIAKMDCLKETSLEIKHCLRQRPAKLIATTWITPPPIGYSFYAITYKYLSDTPANLFANGSLNSEAMMLGVTKDEGSIAGIKMPDYYDTNNFISMIIRNKRGFPRVPHIDDLIIHEYMQWENLHPENVSGKKSLSELFGDYSLTYPCIQCVELLAKRKFPVYFYTFFHRSTEDKRPEWVGVPHGEDIFYLFGAPLVGHALRNYTDLDKEVSKTLMTFFGNFVKTGKAFIGTQEFQYYRSKEKQFIKFYSENNTALVSHDSNYLPRRMAFWANLISTLQNKTAIEEKMMRDREQKEAQKTSTYQLLTWFFVSLCLILMFTTGLFLLILYKRKNILSVPTSVSSRNTPVSMSEVQGTAHLVSKEAKQNTNKKCSPINA